MPNHPQTTNHPTAHPTNRPPVGGQAVGRLGALFYAVVAVVALVGQTSAAVGWLNFPVLFALIAVAALELGGIVLSAQADHRRRLGERALAARALSAAVAVFAVGFNWFGHGDNRLAGGFFAGMSALGYLVWLIQSGNRRRDQLRSTGMLPPVPPAYPVGQWVRHPWITSRARQLALADTNLGLYDSLELARRLHRAEQRQRAIAKVLRQELRRNSDKLAAKVAVNTYDLDELAQRLADQADYEGLTGLVANRLRPARLIDQQQANGSTVRRPTTSHPALTARPTDRPDQQNTQPPASRQQTTQPSVDTDTATQPETAPEPTAHPTDSEPPTQPETVKRPAPESSTDDPPNRSANRRRLRVVGERAAVRNARELRQLYPDGLPTTERQIRARTGWSKERVGPAVAAYLAGEDRQPQQGDDDSDDTEHQSEPEPVAVNG